MEKLKTLSMIVKIFALSIFCLCFFESTITGQITQTIRGKVVDNESKAPLPGANIIIENTNHLLGTITGDDGSFKIDIVPLGRHNIKISFVGYDPIVLPSVLVNSSKEVILNIELKESINGLKEVVVKANSNKDKPQNTMATLSARTFSVEEARKYAGGVDDPARLASAFAGVSMMAMGDNAIIIRGNAPTGVLWRLEGVDIPYPNHFGNAEILGGGLVCAISSNVLGNSDFFTGAFPAEYGNANAGVFDLKLRSGNNEKREHTFQAGSMGVDIASEGPFAKGGKASYVFNYRYSTFAIIKNFVPLGNEVPIYQDLTFKLNFPTKKLGTFSFWGFGGKDFIKQDAKTNPQQWISSHDRNQFKTNIMYGALGISNSKVFGSKTYLKSSLVASGNLMDHINDRVDNNINLYRELSSKTTDTKYTFSSTINHKIKPGITFRAGLVYNYLNYSIDRKYSDGFEEPTYQIADETGNSTRINSFVQSKINITPNIEFNPGMHLNYFGVTNKYSYEPRLGLAWNFNNQRLSFAYGLHSQTELLNYYFVRKEENGIVSTPNKKLDFAKAHHFVIGFDTKLNEFTRLKIEPYYQHLYNLPVVPDSNFCIINIEGYESFNEPLVNDGYGRNYGIDITLERFLNDGFYYLISGSFFNSEYKCNTKDKWKNTRHNNNYVINLLAGKEWEIGQNGARVLGVNGRLYYMGGRRYTPLNEEQPNNGEEIMYDYSRKFESQYPNTFRVDLTVSYRRNREKLSTVWSVQMLNTFGALDYFGYRYNYQLRDVEMYSESFPFPVLNFRIEF